MQSSVFLIAPALAAALTAAFDDSVAERPGADLSLANAVRACCQEMRQHGTSACDSLQQMLAVLFARQAPAGSAAPSTRCISHAYSQLLAAHGRSCRVA